MCSIVVNKAITHAADESHQLHQLELVHNFIKNQRRSLHFLKWDSLFEINHSNLCSYFRAQVVIQQIHRQTNKPISHELTKIQDIKS